jgi:hypothetical protein
MSGELDRQYVVARGVPLDALEALGAPRAAVILIGTQAIYLHTGVVELAIAEFTTDADLALDPVLLQPAPEIESAMTAAGFSRGNRVGAWVVSRDIDGTPTNVEVDLMVPQGGFGNLVALPLQKGPRKQDNSVFLDDDFVPWTDRWAFLARARDDGRDLARRRAAPGHLHGMSDSHDDDRRDRLHDLHVVDGPHAADTEFHSGGGDGMTKAEDSGG